MRTELLVMTSQVNPTTSVPLVTVLDIADGVAVEARNRSLLKNALLLSTHPESTKLCRSSVFVEGYAYNPRTDGK
jgi:hypothetical protein